MEINGKTVKCVNVHPLHDTVVSGQHHSSCRAGMGFRALTSAFSKRFWPVPKDGQAGVFKLIRYALLVSIMWHANLDTFKYNNVGHQRSTCRMDLVLTVETLWLKAWLPLPSSIFPLSIVTAIGALVPSWCPFTGCVFVSFRCWWPTKVHLAIGNLLSVASISRMGLMVWIEGKLGVRLGLARACAPSPFWLVSGSHWSCFRLYVLFCCLNTTRIHTSQLTALTHITDTILTITPHSFLFFFLIE